MFWGDIMEKVNIIMPKFGLTMTKGTIVEWKKKIGEKVKKDEVIAIIESEKLTGEIKAPENGTLVEILYKVGDEVLVGETIAIIEVEE